MYINKLMKLKIITTIGDILIEDVQEYVCGKQYFYINILLTNETYEIKTINRNIIHEVFRFDGTFEWPIHLKTFKERL